MVLGPIVIDLGIVLIFLVGFALCLLAERIVRALFGTLESKVGWIPFVGRVIAAPIHTIEQKFTNILGSAIRSLEGRIGAAWHSSARLVEETAGKIESAFALSFALTEALVTLPTWPNVLALYHSLVGKDRATISNVREHTKAIAHAQKAAAVAAQTANVAKVRAQAIPADVVIPGDLAGIRAGTRAVEDSLARLWQRVRGLSPSSVVGIGLGALAFALGKLGVGWARCSNVDKIGRNICGIDHGFLESLLAGSLAILGTLSLVELAHAMLAVEDELVHGVRFGFREFSHIATRSAEQQGFVVPG